MYVGNKDQQQISHKHSFCTHSLYWNHATVFPPNQTFKLARARGGGRVLNICLLHDFYPLQIIFHFQFSLPHNICLSVERAYAPHRHQLIPKIFIAFWQLINLLLAVFNNYFLLLFAFRFSIAVRFLCVLTRSIKDSPAHDCIYMIYCAQLTCCLMLYQKRYIINIVFSDKIVGINQK